MKNLLALLLALTMALTLCACGSTPAASSLDQPAGKSDPFDFGDTAYTVRIPVYDLVEREIYSMSYRYSDFVLDEQGRVAEKKVSGSENGTYTYTYDDQGRVLTENYTSNSGSYDNYTYTYNEHGEIATQAESSDGFRDGNFWEHSYQYDDQGRVIEMAEVNTAADDHTIVYTYEYDEDGNPARETQTTYPDGLSGKRGNRYVLENSFDSQGRKIRSVSQKEGESERSTSTYTYDCVGCRECSPADTPDLKTTDCWAPFAECAALPTPDSCVGPITYARDDSNADAVIHTYYLGKDEAAANGAYHLYQGILGDVCGFTLQVEDSGLVYLLRDGQLLSAMMAGHDPELGWFLQVSFPA